MALSRAPLRSLFQRWPRLGGPTLGADYEADELPLRAELLSADQLAEYGIRLAQSHSLGTPAGADARDQLLPRLAANETVLVNACTLLSTAVEAERAIAPAGEWLLDNFYLIEEQIRTARKHLPKTYSRELPRLDAGPSAGLPRVYDLALEAIAHGDGRIDPEGLSHFVAAYQRSSRLKIGELWAVPIMLRLALIENLRRVAALVAASRIHRNLAERWAEQMTEVAERDPKSLILVVADMARSRPPMSGAFVAELTRRLQGQGAALALSWIEQRLAEDNLTTAQLVLAENQQQAADQVSIGNSIGSLRLLAAVDWRSFVESLSTVEASLREDPAGLYAQMDFTTRDRYRHVVEQLGRHCAASEADIAQAALALAQASAGHADERRTHVGYWLVDAGLPQLERQLSVRYPLSELPQRWIARAPLPIFLGSIGALTFAITALLLRQAHLDGLDGWPLAALGIAALLAGSQLAVALVNWLATMAASPVPVPRMDFSAGIPAESRTLVVVPCLLEDLRTVDELIEALEVRFLANRDRQLYFGLLSDFRDAPAAVQPEDAALLARARAGIEQLNERYRSSGDDRFCLFHRPRRWNPQEGAWIGHERKRGKLADLNALLRGAAGKSFSDVLAPEEVFDGVRYVITLDSDTQLPRDSAAQLVGAMAHLLNRPRYDEHLGRVTAGHGILQPRMAVSLPEQPRSRYAQLHGSDAGIDPYTRAVSDVYQDLFGEGSFIGKGIYDVDAFERALRYRVPENRVLSHDLLEGCHARAGLINDVQLYEEYPARYAVDVSRQQRWIRGDWQIAPWLLPRVRAADGRRRRNPLSPLSRWKVLDNLRRSGVASSLLALLLFGWLASPRPLWWTLAVLALLLLPAVLAAAFDVLHKPEELLLRQHLSGTLQAAARRGAQLLFQLACLPFEMAYSVDAILRTNLRMLVTQRRLLQWRTADSARRHAATGLAASYRRMLAAPLLAALAAFAILLRNPAALFAAAPVLALWCAAPALAEWLSRPRPREDAGLGAAQTRFLRELARRTWHFFETYVGPEDHWLPPDNFQEQPSPVVAHRTSPTNIGLALLANLSAYDFGYLPAGGLLERSAQTLKTLQQLARFHGHFFNWYDTLTLAPLRPQYISSVDSGNLAGHLLTLRPGLLALAEQPALATPCFAGLADTARLLTTAAADAEAPSLAAFVAQLAALPDAPSLPQTQAALLHLAGLADTLVARFADANDDAAVWSQALARQCASALAELDLLAPWLHLPAAPAGLAALAEALQTPMTLRELAQIDTRLLPRFAAAGDADAGAADWLRLARQNIADTAKAARERLALIAQLADFAGELAQMQYGFLYDSSRRLLAIGYNVDEMRRDASYYDLLASEARLCTYVGIAQQQLPQESWFALGRLYTGAGGEPTLLSWSGSMFEYLMPQLVMPAYDDTLLAQTGRATVARQIEYGRLRGVAWGVSESGYNATDAAHNYQYRAFGVPGLGLKRGLADDLVIAPYATALALMVAPRAACANLERLETEGFGSRYGFYEAIDYTPARLPPGREHVVIRSYMAHHQGMSLLALAYALLDRPMQRRFVADPALQATLLLLQERIPKAASQHLHVAEHADAAARAQAAEMPLRVITRLDTAVPEVKLLSNGRYHLMVSHTGGGYSRWKDLTLTRWREDTTRDHWGAFCYLRDVGSGAVWSNTHQPTLQAADHYEAMFSEGRAEFRRRDHDYEVHTEIVVSPEDDIELRRVRISNRARTTRVIEVTSCAEVVLATAAADLAHTAFSKLFVQTEIVPERQAILCTRRPRSPEEITPWLFHLMAVHGADSSAVSFETDRLRFIGRGRDLAAPRALDAATVTLSGTDGAVLDPIVAIRHRITLGPGQSVTVDLVTGVGEQREACLHLVGKYQDRHLADRVFDLAWTHANVTLRQINASDSDAQLYARLAASVIYDNPGLRAEAGILVQNRRGQSGLWSYAISGDLPIVLLQIGDIANIDLVRQLVQAHAYWRLKGLAVDLVIWNDDHASYRQLLQDQIMGLITTGLEANLIDRPGGIFVRLAEQIPAEDRILLQTVARVIISDARGTLLEQVNRRAPVLSQVPKLAPLRAARSELATTALALSRPERRLDNGLGGYSADGREYVITTEPGRATPAPWVNVLANAQFGTVVSESGLAYTWSENAHEFRLTPWHDDAVGGSGGEAFYLRDEDSGRVWSPTPWPAGGEVNHICRHGFGYTVFESVQHGIHSELSIHVDRDESIKFVALKVRNASGRSRRLSATGYTEWVLGDLRGKTAAHVITELDPATGALFARNPYNTEFAGRVAFFDIDEPARSVTGDRAEFIGRNGTLAAPAALRRLRLSGKVGAALDPCGALQVPFELADGQSRELVFRLGCGADFDDARARMRRHRGATAARDSLQKVLDYWTHTLGAVQVATPDESLNLLCNGWLVYQTLACRLWARSGYYQSGGAYGYRDQLQDTMALLHAEPRLLREHLLRAAARQFHDGDVQHWWHPPTGRGVRTMCSDDYLWLPLATSRYVLATGDTGVLHEAAHFIDGRPLAPHEESYYDQPARSAETASLYHHCVRALEHGLRYGVHGLPLMGSGDWNDGMDRVGAQGRGESVWLGFFLHHVLLRFAQVARLHGDHDFVARCHREADALRANLDDHAWDGDWYRRAYFDDGTPLGSTANSECRIDSIAQSWSVLSGAGDATKQRAAMASLERHLIDREHRIVRLLTPPFDTQLPHPGYIRGYLPGVRENGGQYTHAAVWAAMAFAELGDAAHAWEVFDMINPLNHARDAAAVAVYKVEPYVIPADVYSRPPHTGRGGWSWYTGSAGWTYRLITESLLGLKLEVDRLTIAPCLPAAWPGFALDYRYRDTRYRITVVQRAGATAQVTLDGVVQANASIPLCNDHGDHAVEVVIPPALRPALPDSSSRMAP